MVLLCGFQGCSSSIELHEAEDLAAQGRWLEAVALYKKAYLEDPKSTELKSRLQQTQLHAAEYFYGRGAELLAEDKFDEASIEFQRGRAAMPQHEKLRLGYQWSLDKKQAEEAFQEASIYQALGREEDVVERLNATLELNPDHGKAIGLLKYYQERKARLEGISFLSLKSTAPVSLNFNSADLKDVFDFLSDSFGVNMIFDESVKTVPVTIYAKFVTFEQALNLVLTTTKTFYKKLNPNTILIAPDTPDKRGQYEDYLIRTFHLKSISAEEMGTILKETLDLKKIVINETLNSILIRDTESTLSLAEKLIIGHDRKPAEVLLDVEILEINRTKSEQLGLDFGSQITVSFPNFEIGDLGDLSDFAQDVLLQGAVTLPPVTLRYFKQDVDAEVLANPKVRTLDGELAKIHIGDRVPLRSSTIQDATGQTRTTFEYRDIGIRLEVEPFVHIDSSVTVYLNLEVSQLGQNLGTASEPAFSIGTRNVNTVMLLKDGETAILGGLIRDEDRKSHVKLPGFGDVPVLGWLFTSTDDQVTRTDVLLTITPRIVRPWQVANKSASTFFSGTKSQLATGPKFAFMEQRTSALDDPEIRLDFGPTASGEIGSPTVLSSRRSEISLDDESEEPPIEVALLQQPTFSFSQPIYSIDEGEEVTVTLIASKFDEAQNVPLVVKYNPNLIRYVSSGPGDAQVGEIAVNEDATNGIVGIELSDVAIDNPEGQTVAEITFLAVNKGISYLLYAAEPVTETSGRTRDAWYKASRIVVK